jgi:hypothetical protein
MKVNEHVHIGIYVAQFYDISCGFRICMYMYTVRDVLLLIFRYTHFPGMELSLSWLGTFTFSWLGTLTFQSWYIHFPG